MSVSKISKGLLLGLALLLATSGFAANKGSLQVDNPVTVNGKPLAAGEYTVKWDGAGPNVELNIMKGKNVVATVPARMVDLEQSPVRDSIITSVNSEGHKSVNEIRFSGKKYALAVERGIRQSGIERDQQVVSDCSQERAARRAALFFLKPTSALTSVLRHLGIDAVRPG